MADNCNNLNGIKDKKMYIFIHISIFKMSTSISFVKPRGRLCSFGEERAQLICNAGSHDQQKVGGMRWRRVGSSCS